MRKKYSELIKGINQRSNPDSYSRTVMFSENKMSTKLNENDNIEYSDVSIYVKKAMQGVAAEYTKNSKIAANKIEAHLFKSHGKDVHFERQGSVMTNTHIIKDSDVDLVQITNKSKGVDHSGLKKALENPVLLNYTEFSNLKVHSDKFTKYEGNQLSDLRLIREKSEKILSSIYNDVDINKENSIYVKVSEPSRDVDVVTATYYKGIEYMKTNHKHRRGIQIFNKKTNGLLEVDYPFWSIKRINERDLSSNGRLKNMIRFLKNLKYDCPNIDDKGAIRSFHINAICYNIKLPSYQYLHFLELVSVLNLEITRILSDKSYRDTIMSVDGIESIFKDNCDKKLEELEFLRLEIDSILSDLNNQNKLIG
jgi:hypothetical protein